MGLIKAVIFFLVSLSGATALDAFIKANENKVKASGTLSQSTYFTRGMIALYIMTLLVALF